MKEQMYHAAQRLTERVLHLHLELTTTRPIPLYEGDPFIDAYVEPVGLTMHLDRREVLDRSYLQGVVDDNCFAFLRDHMAPDGAFVDIGANQGIYSCVVLKDYPGAKVVSIEPDPYSLEKIQRNVALNALDTTRLHVFPVAVVDVPGDRELMINVAGNRAGSSLVVDQRQWTGRAENVTVTVPGRTLRDMLDETGCESVSVAKIDIEGYEFPALNTFLRDAPRSQYPRAFIVEAFGHCIPLVGGSTVELLIQAGYHLVDHDTYNYFFVLSDD